MRRSEITVLLIAGIIFIIALAVMLGLKWIDIAQAMTLTITFILVCITAIYVARTADIAQATKEQADASVKMANEMREQRVIASRPVIIQEAIPRKYIIERDMSDYFQIYNAGSSPAIELEISVLNQKKIPVYSERKTVLRSNEPPMQFTPFDSVQLEESKYFLICEYRSIFSRAPYLTWYQTLLPFELKFKKEGKAYVVAGELEFIDEVSEKDCIDAFSSRSKPK